MDLELAPEVAFAGIASICSLLAVWMPFYRGVRVYFNAHSATRRFSTKALVRAYKEGSGGETEPFAPLMLRLFESAMRDNAAKHPREFLIDATKQYVVNEYDSNYARRISMYANILPPIGFIGTTTGLLILFVSMGGDNSSLELGALALALVSSIVALIGFATLEALKIGLYARLLDCLGDTVSVVERASSPASSGA